MKQIAHPHQGTLWQPEEDEKTLALPVQLPKGDLRRGSAEHSVLVGTSGFSFKDWTGPFYPKSLPPAEWLPFYARYFSAVEINSTYYGIPSPSVLERLVEKTPAEFEFMVKANQQMTHGNGSQADGKIHENFLRCLEPLRQEDRLRGVLAQYPWRFRPSPASRAQILELQKSLGRIPFFVEFRHASWIEGEVFRFLEDHGIGYCSVDEPNLNGLVPPLARLTSSVGYVRLHGRNQRNWWGAGEGDRYDYDYRREELEEWLIKIRELAEKADRTYVFFNNCHAGQAARNARLMMDLLQQEQG